MTDETAEPFPIPVRVAEFEARYPEIEWRTPLRVNDRYYGCRVCIALFGLKGSDVDKLPRTHQEWKLHFLRHLITERL